MAAVSAVLGAVTVGIMGGSPAAWAGTTAPYMLYCPQTPVGNIALNGVTTSASLTPASPSSGSSFQVTGYQAQVTIPATIVSAAAALGNSAVQGTAKATLDLTGATPATLTPPSLSFDQPIPNPVPTSGLTLSLPATPATAGSATATSSSITVAADKSTALTLVVSGNSLSLTCTAFPNNTIATSGIVPPGTAAPAASAAISPVIVTSSGGTSGQTTATTSAPATTAPAATPTTAPATSPGDSSALANTGAGPGIWMLGEIGLGALCAAALVLFGDRARRALVTARNGPRSRRQP